MSNWKDYLELCKPRVVALMLLTSIVGMLLASPGFVPINSLVFGTIGIALAASCGAVLNHLVDKRIDAIMYRTQNRPIASGRVSSINAILFAFILGIIGLGILILWVNTLTAILSLIALIGYAVIYTVFLKRSTPQNIVIGGLAGAMPPLLGWVAVTGHMNYPAWLLVLIIFAWTPPHFWALSIYRFDEYANAKIPMLPVTHGIPYTKLNILLYTILLAAVSYLPFIITTSGLIYVIVVSLLNIRFLYWAVKLYRNDDRMIALKTFRYSIIYLMLLFVGLLVDHYLKIL